MLTEAAIDKMQAELRRLRITFAELHEESLASPLAKRRGSGLLLAMREWEPAGFTHLRRLNRGPSRSTSGARSLRYAPGVALNLAAAAGQTPF